ncbi:MAG TPA: hypothetical protein VI461_02495 [Chitinophagaceae bacterium]|nr:hypothetical protein [Chitinophagaceae bacterium]
MRKLVVLLFIAAFVNACNSKGLRENRKEKNSRVENKTGRNDSIEKNKNSSSHSWTKAEQDRFIGDCIKGYEEEDIDEEDLNDFCTCMLTEAQKYYARYHHMDEKSNEEHDKEIVDKCVGIYLKAEQ